MTIINSQTSTVNDCIPTLATHSKDSESSFWNSVNHVSMWEGWVPRHFASKSRAAASCPEHRDRASVPWSFQRCLDVFLGFCWRKETAHAKLVFRRKNYSLEMLRDFLECSYFEQNEIPFRFTRGLKIKVYEGNLVSGVKSSISFAKLLLFLAIHALNQVILTKKPEFHPAHPSSSESTTKWWRWREPNANQRIWACARDNEMTETIQNNKTL